MEILLVRIGFMSEVFDNYLESRTSEWSDVMMMEE